MVDIVAVNNFGDTRSGGLTGPMGLLVIALMCIATVLLIRNMNKRLRRLPDSFEDPKDAEQDGAVAERNATGSGQDGDGRPADVDDDRSAALAPDKEPQVNDVDSDGSAAGGDGRRTSA
jgi:hypothetical protein